MQITVILNTHGDVPLVKDTLESIMAWMTHDVLVVVDDHAWPEFEQEELPVSVLRGFYHNYPRSPYRNIVYGLYAAGQHWPHADWYVYLEYDCLVASPNFVSDLEKATADGVWLLGTDLRRNQKERFPLVNDLLKAQLSDVSYLLGACLFYRGDFIRKGIELGFWEKFLYYTNDFCQGFFPGFEGYDLIEHMMPTLAEHWGGKLAQLSSWGNGQWHGNFCKYPIRWQPELNAEEVAVEASILHPLKSLDHPLRQTHKRRRQRAGKYSFAG